MDIDLSEQFRRGITTLSRQLRGATMDFLSRFFHAIHNIDRAASTCGHQHHFHWTWSTRSTVPIHHNRMTGIR
ncbi:Uncharacterised protein [Vibrio cholerae]|nr:Uncharacterised protein [Vibrio cholerae]